MTLAGESMGGARAKSIAEVSCRSPRSRDFPNALTLGPREQADRRQVPADDPVALVSLDAGLEYPFRPGRRPRCPAGEAQRIRLATQIGPAWWVCSAVLDEPSIGRTSATTVAEAAHENEPRLAVLVVTVGDR